MLIVSKAAQEITIGVKQKVIKRKAVVFVKSAACIESGDK